MEKSPFLTSNLAPYEVLSTEGLEIIEDNAETILERVGVDITDAQAVKDFADAGADVGRNQGPFPPGGCAANSSPQPPPHPSPRWPAIPPDRW